MGPPERERRPAGDRDGVGIIGGQADDEVNPTARGIALSPSYVAILDAEADAGGGGDG